MLLKPAPPRIAILLAPAGEARLVTNWEQWKNTFGDFTFTEADGTTTVNDNIPWRMRSTAFSTTAAPAAGSCASPMPSVRTMWKQR
jgi:hypothetical protein